MVRADEAAFDRRSVVTAGGVAVLSSLVLPSTAWAVSGETAEATTLTVDSTLTGDGEVSVAWTDTGAV